MFDWNTFYLYIIARIYAAAVSWTRVAAEVEDVLYS